MQSGVPPALPGSPFKPTLSVAERVGLSGAPSLTKPLRTILDLAAADTMPREELSKALLRIVERGLITRKQIKSAWIPEAAMLQLEALLGWKKG